MHRSLLTFTTLAFLPTFACAHPAATSATGTAPAPTLAGSSRRDQPLVGGGEHDWAYLLGRLGWLKFDHLIARDAWFIGVLAYIVAIGGGLLVLNNTPPLPEAPEPATPLS